MYHTELPEYKKIGPKILVKSIGSDLLNTKRGFSCSMITVPAKSRLVKSGFPYTNSLASFEIDSSSWNHFSAAISSCVQQSFKERSESVLCGLVSGSLLAAGIGPLCIMAGVAAARSSARAIEQEKIEQSIGELQPLYEILGAWNQEYFLPRGLAARLDVPFSRDSEDENVFGRLWRDIKGGYSFPGGGDSIMSAVYIAVKEENPRLFWVTGIEKPRLVVTCI